MKHFILPVLVLCVAGMLLSIFGCTSSRNVLVIKDDPLKVVQNENIFISVRFLDEEVLMKRFGTTSNPFLTIYGSLQFNRIVPFEVTVQPKSQPVFLRLNQFELQFGAGQARPYNQYGLTDYWRIMDERYLSELERQPDRNKKPLIIRREVLPNEITVAAGERHKGIVVFVWNTPQYGNYKLMVPVFDPSDKQKPLDVYPFPFEF